ncbi:hypothetical protein AURDEDRAFT_170807 [Auricularia subglabra TFB-10046 SS5]|nr:hypothetical protein AURDEDRAFT_170807 [Auricularia subglabra TFB-10046 SS5]
MPQLEELALFLVTFKRYEGEMPIPTFRLRRCVYSKGQGLVLAARSISGHASPSVRLTPRSPQTGGRGNIELEIIGLVSAFTTALHPERSPFDWDEAHAEADTALARVLHTACPLRRLRALTLKLLVPASRQLALTRAACGERHIQFRLILQQAR